MGRRRSNSVRGEHPFVTPLNPEDQKLAALVNRINEENAAATLARQLAAPPPPEYFPPPSFAASLSPIQPLRTPPPEVLSSIGQSKEDWRTEFKPHPEDLPSLFDDNFFDIGYRGTSRPNKTDISDTFSSPRAQYDRPERIDARTSRPYSSAKASPKPGFAQQPFVFGSHTSQVQFNKTPTRQPKTDTYSTPRNTVTQKSVIGGSQKSQVQQKTIQIPAPRLYSKFKSRSRMNYQNYNDSGPGAGPRQAPSPQGMNHANGLNGAIGMPAMMAGLPTPAGHQSDLNYIQQMVEQLSQVLEENRAATARITVSADRVRERALEMDMTNDEIIKEVSAALNASSIGLEEENARLRKELDHARYEEKANLDLCRQFQKQMAHMLEQAHVFKLKTTEDMCAWHRSYRNQLADEREKNLQLTCQILDMQEHAARGMEALRKFRRAWEDNPFHNELQVQVVQYRQLARFWKRLALRELPDDDSEFSDDSDIIDPAEKKRLVQVEADKIRARKAEQKEQKEAAANATASSSGSAVQ